MKKQKKTRKEIFNAPGGDGKSISERVAAPTLLLCPVLAMGGGHITGHDSKASDWMRGDDDEWGSSTKEFHSINVYN